MLTNVQEMLRESLLSFIPPNNVLPIVEGLALKYNSYAFGAVTSEKAGPAYLTSLEASFDIYVYNNVKRMPYTIPSISIGSTDTVADIRTSLLVNFLHMLGKDSRQYAEALGTPLLSKLMQEILRLPNIKAKQGSTIFESPMWLHTELTPSMVKSLYMFDKTMRVSFQANQYYMLYDDHQHFGTILASLDPKDNQIWVVYGAWERQGDKYAPTNRDIIKDKYNLVTKLQK